MNGRRHLGTMLAAVLVLACCSIGVAAAEDPAGANRKLPKILSPDFGTAAPGATGQGRLVPRPVLPGYSNGSDTGGSGGLPSPRGTAQHSPLGDLFRAAEQANQGSGLAPPDMTTPDLLRRHLAMPDFSAPLPPPPSVVAAMPDATAREHAYVSDLLRIPRAADTDTGYVSRGGPSRLGTLTVSAPAVPPEPAAPPALQNLPSPKAPPPAHVAAPPPAPSLAMTFRPGSAAVPGSVGPALGHFAAQVSADPAALVRLRVAAPAGLPGPTARLLADSRARALRRALAERRIAPQRVAVELVAAGTLGTEAGSAPDAVLELVKGRSGS